MPKNPESLNFELFNSFQWHLSGSPAAGVSCAWLSSCGVPHSLQEAVAVGHPLVQHAEGRRDAW